MRIFRSLAFTLTFFLAAAVGCGAQETIASDRPGIGSGATVIGRGIIQLETGISVGGSGDATRLSAGEVLVRVGLSVLEVEVFGNSFSLRLDDVPDGDGEGESGFQDLGFGTKVRIFRGERVSFALQGLAIAPTGASTLTADRWLFRGVALLDWAVGSRTGLSLNLGVLDGRRTPALVSASVTPGWTLGSGFGVYAGWAGEFVEDSDLNFLEAGGTWLATPNVQLDVNGGWSVDEDAWFVGLGIALRRVPG